jgi:glycosyltransferase family protein
MMRHIIDIARNLTPLSLRRIAGPYFAWMAYFYRTRLTENSKFPTVLDIDETIAAINKNKLSVIRFGDGELSLIEGHDLGFQRFDPDLAARLIETLATQHEKLLVCVPDIFNKLEQYTPTSYWFELHHLFRYGHVWETYLNRNQIYGDALLTRPYLGRKDKENSGARFNGLKEIWDSEDITLIEGAQSRLGVGNDLFAHAKSISRILCPPENCWSRVKDIENEVLKASKDSLILLSLGPTAKPLALTLFEKGYRVIDIGHIDMEYEMFTRGHKKITALPNKYFNEANARTPTDCADGAYLSQIIARIDSI